MKLIRLRICVQNNDQNALFEEHHLVDVRAIGALYTCFQDHDKIPSSEEYQFTEVRICRDLARYLLSIECLEPFVQVISLSAEDFIELRLVKPIWDLLKDDLSCGKMQGARFSIENNRLTVSDHMLDFISNTYRTYQLEELYPMCRDSAGFLENIPPPIPGESAIKEVHQNGEDERLLELHYQFAMETDEEYEADRIMLEKNESDEDDQTVLRTNRDDQRGNFIVFMNPELGRLFQEGRWFPIVSSISILDQDFWELVITPSLYRLLYVDLLEAKRRGVTFFSGVHRGIPCLVSTGGLLEYLKNKYRRYGGDDDGELP